MQPSSHSFLAYRLTHLLSEALGRLPTLAVLCDLSTLRAHIEERQQFVPSRRGRGCGLLKRRWPRRGPGRRPARLPADGTLRDVFRFTSLVEINLVPTVIVAIRKKPTPGHRPSYWISENIACLEAFQRIFDPSARRALLVEAQHFMFLLFWRQSTPTRALGQHQDRQSRFTALDEKDLASARAA